MRQTTTELKDATAAYLRAIKPTTALIHRLIAAVAQDTAICLGGAVRIILPGNIVIERNDKSDRTKPVRIARR